MTNHEAADNDFSPQTETALEQGIYNYTMAEAAETGCWPDGKPDASSEATAKPRRRRTYNETSGRDQSRNIANQEREEAIARGETAAEPSSAYRAARALLAQAVDSKKADGDVSRQMALSQARAERRQS